MIKKFADKANEFLPDLIKQTVYPKNFVTVFDDENEYFGCRAEKCREKDAFENGETFTLDFGGHITGYFSFTL